MPPAHAVGDVFRPAARRARWPARGRCASPPAGAATAARRTDGRSVAVTRRRPPALRQRRRRMSLRPRRAADGRSLIAAPPINAATTTPPPDRCDDRWSSPGLHTTTPSAPSYRRCSVHVAALLPAVTSSNVVIGNTAERCRRQRRRVSLTTATVPARPPAGTAARRPAALGPPRLRTARRRSSVRSAGVERRRRQTAATIADRRPFTPPHAHSATEPHVACAAGRHRTTSLLTSSATSLCVAARSRAATLAAPLHTAER